MPHTESHVRPMGYARATVADSERETASRHRGAGNVLATRSCGNVLDGMPSADPQSGAWLALIIVLGVVFYWPVVRLIAHLWHS